jgi:hypothetical protein
MCLRLGGHEEESGAGDRSARTLLGVRIADLADAREEAITRLGLCYGEVVGTVKAVNCASLYVYG